MAGTAGSEPAAVDDDAVAQVHAGDERTFGQLVEPHRRELRVHCYRMTGSLDDAEDLVQETLLRAWRRRETFEGRSSLRAWLYRIATNACLEQLRRTPRVTPSRPDDGRLPPYSALPWLQPFPDALLDAPAPEQEAPDALVVARETIELAYLTAVQLLPPRQRAVLLLRDVLAFSAAETAELLDLSVPAANSALQRARATLASSQGSRDEASAASASPHERELVDRYIRAHEEVDPAAIVAVLRADARLTISPVGACWDGRDEIAPPYLERMGSLGDWRCVPTSANRQPAVAHYLRRFGEHEFRAFSLVVLGIQGAELVEIATFASPELFAAFGLADVLS
ncbi:MAG TPA: RNA polymerase subunit sigma-70 [Mycobacteriales bacterium]|nr:RNA polymerase subunit sigma-70 [Mycobacteriales bacterium]